jgi:hypothetical protein
MPTGDPMTVFDVEPAVTFHGEYVSRFSTTAVVRRVTKEQIRYVPGGTPPWNLVAPDGRLTGSAA